MQLTQELLVVLGKCFQRRAIRRAAQQVDEIDEEDEEQLMEESALDQEVQFCLADCIGGLLKTHTTAYLPTFQKELWEKLCEVQS